MTRKPSLVYLILILGTSGPAAAQDERVAEQLKTSLKQYRTPADWDHRREEIREHFLRGAKLWPLPEKPMLKVMRRGRRDHAGYSVENVAIETLEGFYCTGNLYRPLGSDAKRSLGERRSQAELGDESAESSSRKYAAVLSPHGHFRPLGRFRPEQQIRCAQLAKMGAVVFSYSMVGWQDSQQTTHDDPLTLALQTWNSIRVVDFLARLDDVDPDRIGVAGASGGGTQSLYVTLVDERIKVSAPAVIVYPWSWFSPACNCEGGMPVMKGARTNAIELAAVAAPRPQLLISCGLLSKGSDQPDPTHNFPAVGFPFIQEVYRRLGHADRVQSLHLADQAHDFGPSKRKALYELCATHLGLDRVEENPDTIVIESPELMRVFDEKHPLPAGALRGSQEVQEAFGRLGHKNE